MARKQGLLQRRGAGLRISDMNDGEHAFSRVVSFGEAMRAARPVAVRTA
jgi:hypothetical protein